MPKRLTQKGLILSYYTKRPNTDIPTAAVVDWATSEWERRTGSPLRDPDRMIRKLAQDGHLVKVRKALYRYDPDAVSSRQLPDFTAQQKKEVLRKGRYKCAVCGLGEANGVDLHVDHIKPKDLGGESVVENGQVLCGQHNYIKKHHRQTEVSKQVFINLREWSLHYSNRELAAFCEDVLTVYDKHGIDGHIEWDRAGASKI